MIYLSAHADDLAHGVAADPIFCEPTTPPGGVDSLSSGWRAAERPRRPVLVVNPRSGGGPAARIGIVERARGLGIEAVVLVPGQSLGALAAAAVAEGADALGMAGGDGSLAVVAAAAAAHELPFVRIRAGTRNHFALDLGVDRNDVAGGLDAFSDGVERWIDMAEVNGRLFLNNVSLGIYGDAVQKTAWHRAHRRHVTARTDRQEPRRARSRAVLIIFADGLCWESHRRGAI